MQSKGSPGTWEILMSPANRTAGEVSRLIKDQAAGRSDAPSDGIEYKRPAQVSGTQGNPEAPETDIGKSEHLMVPLKQGK